MNLVSSRFHSAANKRGTTVSLAVAVCFFLSGGAGLVYEVIWVRLIDKVIGSAPFAVATVLSVFMGGLALGGYLAGRYIDRLASRRSLLALYGKLEISLGLYALGLPFLILAVKPIYRLIYDLLLDHFWWYQAAAFTGCLLLFLVPAALMGATLPVLCRFYVQHVDHVGTRTGRLYGLNTAGAALGVVLCGFVLIKHAGVWTTLVSTAGLNLTVGAACLLLSRFALSDTAMKDKGIGSAEAAADRPSAGRKAPVLNRLKSRRMHWALILFAGSGFCAMSYQVLWTRLLGLVAGPTTYCFSLVVATFITGLALGSILFSRTADRTHRVFHWLVGTQILAAGSALFVSQLLGGSQFFFAKLIHTFQDQFSRLIAAQSLTIFIALLPTTLFLGAAFPLVNRLYVRSLSAMGRSLGTAYAFNTIGAIAGSLAAGFILVPLLGKENSLRLIILLQTTLAALALIHAGFQGRRTAGKRVLPVAVLLAACLLLGRYPSWRPELLSRGWYRDAKPIEQDLEHCYTPFKNWTSLKSMNRWWPPAVSFFRPGTTAALKIPEPGSSSRTAATTWR